MELLERHRRTLTMFDRLVHRVADDQWGDATPCTEWTVRDLVAHLVSEQLWVPHLLDGATLADVGDRYDGDVLGDDPVGAWEKASAASRAAWTADGALDRAVHLSFGEADASLLCQQNTGDLALHAWDLAMGIGAPQPIDEDLAERLLRISIPILEALPTSHLLAPPLPVPDTASAADRLVALFGREPRWAQPTQGGHADPATVAGDSDVRMR